MNKSIYTVEKICVICEKAFTVTKVRSRLSMIKQDSDFCTYYKELNPYYYSIWVCPHCGYAAQDTTFLELPQKAETIRNFLEGKQVNVDFSGIRTREQAIATFKLAIFFAEMACYPASRLAGLYLKFAWLFREGEDLFQEHAALDKAREYYEMTFLKEKLPIGNMTELTVEYLCGELLRRTGKPSEALMYLNKVISNPKAKQERRILELTRTSIENVRTAKKQQTDIADN